MIVTLKQAASLIITGHVVAVPTETVYGLAASIHQPKAIETIFTLKKRPKDNPLIVHLASIKDLPAYTLDIPPSALSLAKTFWPGPLTLILKANPDLISDDIRAHSPLAAFRVPNHEITQKLLSLTGPLVMPSANLSGSPSATSSSHVLEDFGESLPVLEGGSSTYGVESTIVIYVEEQWKIARLGSISPEQFLQPLGYIPQIIIEKGQKKPLCPGQMYRHYAPNASLELVLEVPADAECTVLGFSDKKYPEKCNVLYMGSSHNAEEVAANLYHLLRTLDAEKISHALIDFTMPDTGLWLTIKERLQKAAVKKDKRTL